MLKIAFLLPVDALPVPDRKGGAIETLMTILLRQNEITEKFQFIFVSPDSMDALMEWKHSKCYTCSILKERFPDHIQHPLKEGEMETLESYPYDYKAKQIVKYENPDYVIMEGSALRIRGCFDGMIPKERIAIHLHGQMEQSKFYRETFGVTIAPSKFIANDWNKHCPENIKNTYLLRNRIDSDRFMTVMSDVERSTLRHNLGFRENDFVVLYCGRLVPVKGVEELLSAVLAIPDPSIKLLMIGSDSFANGNHGNYAKEIVKKADINQDRIRYLGYIDNYHIPKYYRCADMQAIPSLCEEAVGLVSLEGMCSGLPLILTNSGGMVEYVPDDAGLKILREENIVNQLVQGILWMKEHPTECYRMGQVGMKAAKNYSAENYYQDFCQLITWWDSIRHIP